MIKRKPPNGYASSPKTYSIDKGDDSKKAPITIIDEAQPTQTLAINTQEKVVQRNNKIKEF